MITENELAAVMPKLPDAQRDGYLPHLQAAAREWGVTSYLREAAFLAQLAHESVQLRYMEEIASGAAYEDRRDLGNTQPGDGRRYKGRGPIQLTGRANYRKYGRLLKLDLEGKPEIAASPHVGFRIAGAFWGTHGLNELADRREFKTITRRINGGLNGYADRVGYYKRALSSLSQNDPLTVNERDPEAPVTVFLRGEQIAEGRLIDNTTWVPLRDLAERRGWTILDIDGDSALLSFQRTRPNVEVRAQILNATGYALLVDLAVKAGWPRPEWDPVQRSVRLV